MKYYYLLLIIVACAGCSSSKEKRPAQTVLTTANLTKQVYEIDPAVENTIRTLNGATVRFPKDAFKLNGAGKVSIGIKEAYSIKDMLLGGLVTETNGKLLTSGGMIYLEARQNGQMLELQKKAGVSIPASNYANGMQLYKGEPEADSSINWVQPKAQDSTPAEYLQNGKAMFMANCASCHTITKHAIGPPLYDALKRAPSKEWLYRYVRNWEDAYKHEDSTGRNYDAYTCCISIYSPTVMNKFPALTDADLDMLFAYIQSESNQNTAEGSPPFARCLPCLDVKMAEGKIPENWDSSFVKKYPQFYINPALPADSFIQETTLPLNKQEPTDITTSPQANNIPQEPNNYTFTIESLGWYNVDALLKDLPGIEEINLIVTLPASYTQYNLNVYLALPERKVFTGADNTKAGNWTFYEENGNTPLYLNDQAYIVAFGEENGKMVYGIKPFITQKENQLNITLSPITEAAFVNHIRKLGFEGLSISVNKKTEHQAERNKIVEETTTLPDGTVQTKPLPRPAAKADTVKYNYYLNDAALQACPCRNKQIK